MSNDTREITGVHDRGRSVGKLVPHSRSAGYRYRDLDGSGVRRIWHRGARKTELPDLRGRRGWCNRKTRVNVSKSSYRNQSDRYQRTGLIPQEASQYAPVCRVKSRFRRPEKMAMLLAHMEERDAYQHHLLENLNLLLLNQPAVPP